MQVLAIDKYAKIADTGHEVCEDYALCGTVDAPWGIVSDGCSSSPDTHVGSLVLSHVAAREMQWIEAKCPRTGSTGEYPLFALNLANRLIAKAETFIEALGVKPHALDTTLLALFEADGKLATLSYGDGCVMVKKRDGSIKVWETNCAANAPCYMTYVSDPDRMLAYRALISRAEESTTEIAYCMSNHDGMWDVSSSAVPPYEGLAHLFCPDEIDFVAVASDGLESFYKKATGEKLPVTEVVKMIMDIKSKKGNFLQRRMKRVIKDLARDGWQHSDDISVSGMLLNHEVQT